MRLIAALAVSAFLTAACVLSACTNDTKKDCAQVMPAPVNVTPDTPSGI